MSFDRVVDVDGMRVMYAGYFEGTDDELRAHCRALRVKPIELMLHEARALLRSIDGGRLSWSDAQCSGMLPLGTTEAALRAAVKAETDFGRTSSGG